jgi:hypothetical protein
LGRGGDLKWQIADVFRKKAAESGLNVDISTPENYSVAIAGDDWYRFLLRCKYQIGVEGGSSLFDWDGSIRKRTEVYVAAHPRATFEEVENACFPGADGAIHLFAISPRHLEACMTMTCQVLVEGDYDGVLLPGKHYIELKRDFSNLDTVLDLVSKDELRQALTAAAWADVVESGNFTYRKFVDHIVQTSLGESRPKGNSGRLPVRHRFAYHWMRLLDRPTTAFLGVPRLASMAMYLGIPRSLRMARRVFLKAPVATKTSVGKKGTVR